MKFLHIADLHIGKRVNGFSMIEDQRYILNNIVDMAVNEGVGAVLIAGDVYDKPIPSSEAVTLLNDFLENLAKKNIKVMAISGNHDSAERLGFGAELISLSGIYLSKPYSGTTEKVQIQDEWGNVNIYLLPFIRPSLVRHYFPEEEILDYNQAMSVVINNLDLNTDERNVLIAHQFVKGGLVGQSEEYNVGGVDEIAAEHYYDFDYVALGHLHGPQHIEKQYIRYAGSPLKYSFSEEKQKKSVTLIELKEKGNVEIKTIPLIPIKDMRTIEGKYLEVTAKEFYEGTNTEDYIQVILKDEEDVPEALGKLRVIYPNIMSLKYDNERTRTSREISLVEDIESKSIIELFEELYVLQNNQELSPVQKEFMNSLIDKIWKGDK